MERRLGASWATGSEAGTVSSVELSHARALLVDTRPLPFGTEGLRAALVPADLGAEAPGKQGMGEQIRVFYPDGRTEQFGLQDYPKTYSVPQLYDEIVHQRLACQSPDHVAFQLVRAARQNGAEPGALRVLDVAAGNGYSGRALRTRGVQEIVGTDYFEEARIAADRDRPGVYAEYLVGDISRELDCDAIAAVIAERKLNAMTCAGALGHLPFDGFVRIWRAFRPGSVVCVSFYDALDETVPPLEEQTEFTQFLRDEIRAGRFALQAQDRFDHRFAMAGSIFRGASVAGRIA